MFVGVIYLNKNRIEELRKRNNITADELAEKLSISRTTLYNYESGKSSIPSDSLLELCNWCAELDSNCAITHKG